MKKYIKCPDRFCGADDCPRCHPGNFRGGVYIEDLEEPEQFHPATALNEDEAI